jgi:serine/threonine-protein kinase
MPHYIAPEEARGVQPSVESDVYSLGATFFHALTGRPPFKGRYKEVVRQHLRRPTPDPRFLAPGLDEGLARLVTRMLEKDPSRRPADMREVAGTVDRIRAGRNVPEITSDAPASEPPGRLLTRRSRTPVDENL